MDILSVCIEEIALEGLDGISLNTFWQRLEIREPPLSLDVNESLVKTYLWNGIVQYPGLAFYRLHNPRLDPTVKKALEPELLNGVYVIDEAQLALENYPLKLVKDGNVRGSCAAYSQRDDVTEAIRGGDGGDAYTLGQVKAAYGDLFVIVASQEEREKALFGPVDRKRIGTELHDFEYILIERVGRSRRAGEIPIATNTSLAETGFNADPKTQFYHRKKLTRSGYISQQSFIYQSLKDRKSKATCIMFLPRFHREVTNLNAKTLYRMADYLENCPYKIEILTKLREFLSVSMKCFKQLMSHHRFVIVEFHPVSMFFEAATEEEANEVDYCKDGSVRTVRCVRLVRHPSEVDDDADHTETDANDDDAEAPMITQIAYNRTVRHEAYARLVAAGPQGLSILEFQKVFGVRNKVARAMVRSLCQSGYVFHYVQDVSRQRVLKIVARCYNNACPMKTWTDSEREKLTKQLTKEDIDSSEKQLEIVEPSSKKRKTESDSKTESKTIKKRKNGGEKKCIPTDAESLDSNLVPAVCADTPDESAANKEPLTRSAGMSESDVKMAMSKENEEAVKRMTAETKAHDIFSYSRSQRLLSAKFMSRVRVVLEAVKEQQVVEHIHILRKAINAQEKEDGHATTMDPKVLNRIIANLDNTGQIKSVKSVITSGQKERKIHIICDPSVDTLTDSRIQAIFDKTALELSKHDAKQKTPKQSKVSNSKVLPGMAFDVKLGKKYGLLPKMKQIETIHKYLFYCMYGYEGVTSGEETGVFEQGPLDECRVYKDEFTFKRFIPPQPKRHGYEEAGWFLTGDIIWTMPLVLFCQVVNICYDIPELVELLSDPIKKYVPMFRQEAALIAKLMYKRGHVFRMLKIFTSMCHMGLLSFGPAVFREKDQIPCYLHKNASLTDSTTSKQGYCQITAEIEYPKIVYKFNSYAEIEDYWNDLQFIAVNTPLGVLRKDSDQPERFDYKQLMTTGTLKLKPWSEPRKPGEIVDTGAIPGDGRGAAGLDTTFFAHRKSNWLHGSLNPFSMKEHYKDEVSRLDSLRKVTTIRKMASVVPRVSILSKLRAQGESSKKGEHQHAKTTTVTKNSNTKQVLVPKCSKRMRKSSTTEPSPPLKRFRVCQQIVKKDKRIKLAKDNLRKHKNNANLVKDLAAKKIMSRLRVRWTTAEDNMLLWFKIGHLFLGYVEVIMSWPDLRDILQKHFPRISADKTSKSCARRLLFMCRNVNTTRTVNLLANKALHDKNLVDKYRKNRIKHKDIIKVDKFDELITDLREVLKGECSAPVLPDSLDDLLKNYTIESCDYLAKANTMTVHKDTESIQDICEATLHSLIHCTVSLGPERETRSVELFKIFKQYPDDLLTTVCRHMVNDRMITKRKTPNDKCKYSLTSLKSYQLSQRYTYRLVRMLPGYHPPDIFEKSLKAYWALLDGFAEGKRPELDCSEVDCPGQTSVLVAYTAFRYMIYTVNIPEYLIVVEFGPDNTEITSLPEHPHSDDEDDELIQTLPKKAPDAVTAPLLEVSPLEERSLIREEVDASVHSRTSNDAKSLSAANAMDELMTKAKDDLKLELKTMKVAKASRYMLSMARHHHFRTMENHERRPKLQSHDCLAVKPCNISVRYKRNLQHPPSRIPTGLTKAIVHDLERVFPNAVDYQKFFSKQKDFFSANECKELNDLYNAVIAKRHIGLTKKELLSLVPCWEQLDKYLTAMLEENIVVRVGVVVHRYVSHPFVRPWLVHAYKGSSSDNTSSSSSSVTQSVANVEASQTRVGESNSEEGVGGAGISGVGGAGISGVGGAGISGVGGAGISGAGGAGISGAGGADISLADLAHDERDDDYDVATSSAAAAVRKSERVRVRCAPWRFPEGPVNKATLQKLLKSVLLLILFKPGISETALFAEFDPILQPVQVLELTEILQRIGAVQVQLLKRVRRPTLFSPRQLLEQVAFDGGDTMKAFLPSLDAIVILGQFISELNQ